MGWLKDDVALITGGGAGLGLALVHRFIDEGASVVVLERDANRADSLKRKFGEKIETVVGDVTSYEDNVKAVETAVERFGRLDTFVANAGVFDFSSHFLNLKGLKFPQPLTSFSRSM
ncbi:SDR family NAD(P)-dependent oxidoreductase [Sphingopyxis sp. BSNA05]|uniref:SDR family NAD(P)-dependent oxidoreductase n=1 Tax=Sphingopyxis sp. BSNA05 TaxID=1236614 RepID=UPI0020B754F9|nr:SDR family NAD(P)-dependent oxidoreductase [Sphingopyxis sp. BSNA05]